MIRFIAKGMNYVLGNYFHKRKMALTCSLEYLHRDRQIDRNYLDHIRLSTLELVSEEIRRRKLTGHAAELGVYRGKFARYINLYFPDRSLYLFDTFEGFDKRDIHKERSEDFSKGDQDFSGTSAETVLARMPHRDKCIIVQGFFPGSAANIDEKFVFVSIDTDLYDPVYEGLKYFFPRLVEGGYIFVHDFNNDNYKGSRRAVEQYCAEQHISFVPIPDSCGSAIISK